MNGAKNWMQQHFWRFQDVGVSRKHPITNFDCTTVSGAPLLKILPHHNSKLFGSVLRQISVTETTSFAIEMPFQTVYFLNIVKQISEDDDDFNKVLCTIQANFGVVKDIN